MFIGHYSAAFAAKAAKPEIPLWHLFVAVQLVDFAWAGLVLAGIEKVRIQPGFLEASMLDLYHMPITHALPSAVLWGLGAMILYHFIYRRLTAWSAAFVVGLAVFSHWVLDLFVHTQDLELYWGGPKVGFGLWSSLILSQVLEIGLLLLTIGIYFRATQNQARRSVWPMVIIGLLVAIQIFSLIPPAEAPTVKAFAVQGLMAYSAIAFLAWLLERKRVGSI